MHRLLPLFTLLLAVLAPAAAQSTQPVMHDHWFNDEEHVQALDWPESLKAIYRDADPAVLMISPMMTQAEPQPTGNDNFGRPIGVMTDDGTLVVVTIRQRYHAPSTGAPVDHPGPRVEENTTNLYLKRSTDRGQTWIDGRSIPHELGGLTPYKWYTSGVNWGTTVRAQDWGGYWGRVLGYKDGVVYTGGHEGFYTSRDNGETWERVNVQKTLHIDGKPFYLAPDMHFHPDAGMVILGQLAQHDLGPTPVIAVANSVDGGVNWESRLIEIGDVRLVEPSFAAFPDDEDAYFVFSRRRRWDDMKAPWSPAQAILRRQEDGDWSMENVQITDIPYAKDDQDTHGLFYNPVSKRFESTVSYRGSDVGDEHMKVKLYSLSLEDARAGKNHWRYDGTIQDHVSGYGNGVRYGRTMESGPNKGKAGAGEGQHPAGIAVDDEFAYITFGSGPNSATWCNSYLVRRTLDTDRLRETLLSRVVEGQRQVNLAGESKIVDTSDNWDTPERPLSSLHDGRWDVPESSAQATGHEAWVEYDFGSPRQVVGATVYGDAGGRYALKSVKIERREGDAWVEVASAGDLEAAAGESTELMFEPVEAERVRVTLGNAGGTGVQLYELQLWTQ